MSFEDRLYPLLGLYERFPAAAKTFIGRTYRALPVGWRLGRRYREFQLLTEEAEGWSTEQAQQYQLRQLQEVLEHAAAHCPLYRERFAAAGFRPSALTCPADLEQCPLLTKQDLIDQREGLVSTAFPASTRLYVTTGGSTGVPVGFYLQKGVSRPKEQAFLEAQWKRAGYFDGARLAVIRGHVTSDHSRGRIASYDATRGWLMLSSSHLSAQRLPEYLEALERFRPDLLHAYPSAALQLAEFLDQAGQSWRIPLQGLLAGSERLTLPQKRLLERTFHCRVYRWYGHSERAVLAGEGRRSALFYFWPAYGFTELGPADEEGLQEVIVTSFHNHLMPLIRYRTGDRVRRVDTDEGAPLEFPWLAASEVAGRDQEFLLSSTGRKISLTAFNMHDQIFDDLYAVQFFQEAAGRAEFRFVPGPRFQRTRLPAIEAGIRRKLGEDFQLTLREVRETEKSARGKHRWLVSQVAGQVKP